MRERERETERDRDRETETERRERRTDRNRDNHDARVPVCRTHSYQGPRQDIKPEAGKFYRAQSWVKLLTDQPGMIGQTLQLEVSFTFTGESTTCPKCLVSSHVLTAW